MPPKKDESSETVLIRARVKRDIALNSIKGIHAMAVQALSDATLLPSLLIRAVD